MESATRVSKLWPLAETVSVVQATLIIIGIEPQTIQEKVEGMSSDEKPSDYIAARTAIVSAIENGTLQGSLELVDLSLEPRNVYPTAKTKATRIDYSASRVNVSSVKKWMRDKGFTSDAFDLLNEQPDGFRDPEHPRYSAKLMAVVEAWESFDPESGNTGTPKQQIMKWLRLNASRFGLTDDTGKPREPLIEELAKVANWAKKGGAPVTKPD